MYGGVYDPGMGTHPSRLALVFSRASVNLRSAGGIGVLTRYGAV